MAQSIGIFDSGLGGLTVLKALSTAFPDESFCYLGDIARLPYGNKSPETIRRYGDQILNWLHSQNVKAIIIACNSASTVYLGENHFVDMPLLNVIEPGSAAALKVSADKKIAVLGTAATIRSHAYRDTLKKLDPKAEAMEIACPLFVPLVEEGVTSDTITDLVIQRYLKDVIEQQIRTVILGCTHYPLMKAALKKNLGSAIQMVESGEVLTQQLQQLFAQGKLKKEGPNTRQIRICITDLTDHFERLAREFMAPESFDPMEKVVL